MFLRCLTADVGGRNEPASTGCSPPARRRPAPTISPRERLVMEWVDGALLAKEKAQALGKSLMPEGCSGSFDITAPGARSTISS